MVPGTGPRGLCQWFRVIWVINGLRALTDLKVLIRMMESEYPASDRRTDGQVEVESQVWSEETLGNGMVDVTSLPVSWNDRTYQSLNWKLEEVILSRQRLTVPRNACSPIGKGS